eukprot:1824615-Rhodomonas_salina.2
MGNCVGKRVHICRGSHLEGPATGLAEARLDLPGQRAVRHRFDGEDLRSRAPSSESSASKRERPRRGHALLARALLGIASSCAARCLWLGRGWRGRARLELELGVLEGDQGRFLRRLEGEDWE